MTLSIDKGRLSNENNSFARMQPISEKKGRESCDESYKWLQEQLLVKEIS